MRFRKRLLRLSNTLNSYHSSTCLLDLRIYSGIDGSTLVRDVIFITPPRRWDLAATRLRILFLINSPPPTSPHSEPVRSQGKNHCDVSHPLLFSRLVPCSPSIARRTTVYQRFSPPASRGRAQRQLRSLLSPPPHHHHHHPPLSPKPSNGSQAPPFSENSSPRPPPPKMAS